MKKIFYFYIIVFASVIFSVNIKAETLSKEEENYFANFPVSANSESGKNPENLFAIIKPDKSVWIYGDGTTEFMGKKVTEPLKLMEDVISIKFFGSSIYMLKSDGSLWYYGNDCYDKYSYASIVKGHFNGTIKFDGEKYYFTENYRPIGAINEPIKIYEGIKKIISSSTFIKKDNSLWDLTYTKSFDIINEKIMDDVSVRTENWNRILKTDNTFWKSCMLEFELGNGKSRFSMPVKVGENIYGFYENGYGDKYFYLNTDGELYEYKNYNSRDYKTSQPVKVMDGVKKIHTDYFLFIIKEDNSLFFYNGNLDEKPIKVMDNVYNVTDDFIIKDDGTLYLIKFENGKFNTEKFLDDIKVRTETLKHEIISKADFDECTLLTKQTIEMQKELISDLDYITENMIKNNSFEEQGKTLYDNKSK